MIKRIRQWLKRRREARRAFYYQREKDAVRRAKERATANCSLYDSRV